MVVLSVSLVSGLSLALSLVPSMHMLCLAVAYMSCDEALSSNTSHCKTLVCCFPETLHTPSKGLACNMGCLFRVHIRRSAHESVKLCFGPRSYDYPFASIKCEL